MVGLTGCLVACSEVKAPPLPIDPAVRERLQAVIDESNALRLSARPASADDLRYIDPTLAGGVDAVGVADRFPLKSHVERYTKARPWSWTYTHEFDGRPRGPQAWPTAGDAHSIRALLSDPDSLMRGIAIEALGTLAQPEDVPLIAALLEDKSPSIHRLIFQRLMSDPPARTGPPPTDPVVILREWRAGNVTDYAHAALRYMTRMKFASRAEFDAWWKHNKNHEHSLWYWQRVIQNELELIEYDPRRWDAVPGESENDRWTRIMLTREKRLNELYRSLADRLAKLPPEVDAKIRLLAYSWPVMRDDYFPDMLELRLSPGRLVELMAEKNLWPDVDWKSGEGHHGRMLRRIAMDPHTPLRFKHADQVRKLIAREQARYYGSNVTYLTILLSRLLPAATGSNLDEPGTRDSVLRAAALSRDGRLIVTELTRVGLPGNLPFLKDAAIAEQEAATDRSANRDVTWAMLQELANPPLTKAKREALFDFLLDPRFELRWSRIWQINSADMELNCAVRAVNAHAGREAIHYVMVSDVRWRPTPELRKELMDIVRAVRDEKVAE